MPDLVAHAGQVAHGQACEEGAFVAGQNLRHSARLTELARQPRQDGARSHADGHGHVSLFPDPGAQALGHGEGAAEQARTARQVHEEIVDGCHLDAWRDIQQ